MRRSDLGLHASSLIIDKSRNINSNKISEFVFPEKQNYVFPISWQNFHLASIIILSNILT